MLFTLSRTCSVCVRPDICRLFEHRVTTPESTRLDESGLNGLSHFVITARKQVCSHLYNGNHTHS